MRVAVFLLAMLSLACPAAANDLDAHRAAREAEREADLDARREARKNRAIERAYQRQIAKEWAAFMEQFVIRKKVPVYSGQYRIGWRVVETPNYAALREYQRRLDVLAWNAMTDQQRRDYALFTVARNTGVIARNTGLIARQLDDVARRLDGVERGLDGVERGLNDVERELRRQAANRMIQDLWPR